jgi:hypothetical protein
VQFNFFFVGVTFKLQFSPFSGGFGLARRLQSSHRISRGYPFNGFP